MLARFSSLVALLGLFGWSSQATAADPTFVIKTISYKKGNGDTITQNFDPTNMVRPMLPQDVMSGGYTVTVKGTFTPPGAAVSATVMVNTAITQGAFTCDDAGKWSIGVKVASLENGTTYEVAPGGEVQIGTVVVTEIVKVKFSVQSMTVVTPGVTPGGG